MRPFNIGFRTVFCLGFFFPFAEDSLAQSVPPNTVRIAPDSASKNIQKLPPLVSDLMDILREMERESPVLYRDLMSRPRKELLAALLNAAETGITPARKSESTKLAKTEYLPCKLMEDGRILYYRARFQSKADTERFASELAEYSKKQTSPFALILDLRFAAGDDNASIPLFLQCLNSFPAPVAVLISKDTKGPAELLAALLERDRKALTIGETTHGTPFPYTITESAGMVWRIPVIAPEWAGIPPKAHNPTIQSNSGETVKYENLNSGNETAKDTVLRKAIDLALSELVLRMEKQKNMKEK